MNRLKMIIKVFQIVLVVVLVGYLIKSNKLDFSKIKLFFAPGFFSVLLIQFLLFLLQVVFISQRQKMLINYIGGNISFYFSLKVALVSTFFNNFLPGGTGGDVLKFYYIKRETGINYSSIGSFIILDRMLGVLGIVMIVSFVIGGLTIFPVQSLNFIHFFSTHRIILVVFICLLMLLRFDTFSDFIFNVAGKLLLGKQIHHFFLAFKKFAHRRRLLLACIVISAFAHMSSVLSITHLFYVLYGKQEAIYSFFLSPFILIATFIPITPGNIGWTEAVGDSIMSITKVGGGATIFAVRRILILLFSITGALYYVTMGIYKSDESLPENE
ncbi:YbhN family protein [Candidatus Latescibacterota bacterium]